MIPPTVLKLSKRDDTAAAVAATTMDVMMTMLVQSDKPKPCIDRLEETYVECPREKNVPTVTGCWPVASNLRVIKSIAWIMLDSC